MADDEIEIVNIEDGLAVFGDEKNAQRFFRNLGLIEMTKPISAAQLNDFIGKPGILAQ